MKNQNILLGEVIKAERKQARLTQKEMGEFSGAGINLISQIENGKETVRFDKLIAVLKVLGLELQLKQGKDGISISPELQRSNEE